MKAWVLAVLVMLALAMIGGCSAEVYEHYDSGGNSYIGANTWWHRMNAATGTPYTCYVRASITQYTSNNYISVKGQVYDQDYGWVTVDKGWLIPDGSKSVTASGSYSGTGLQSDAYYGHEAHVEYQTYAGGNNISYNSYQMVVTGTNYTITGDIGCIEHIDMYIYTDTWKYIIDSNVSGDSTYSYDIVYGHDYRIIFDGAYYDFTCDGDEVFDYDMCTYVYGYTCGIDTIKLYDDNSQVVDSVAQSSGYDGYEMIIEDGEEYTITFYDMGILFCYNQTFTCTGDHVLINFDRCHYVYPSRPVGSPYIIYLWTGYDYNIVVFRDEHGNFIENSQLAIYDKTDNKYLQRWTDASDGYALLGAKFDTDHDAKLMLRTFDGVYTLDTPFPANGSAEVGEENITTTNWTIPIQYNLNILPVDQSGMAMFNVFCGLSEYTSLNPQAFWGMDLSDRGYVPVSNCSGFAMCDIIAEKDGYADYNETALNWTSKSALVKDYRHNIVMEVE